MKTLYWYKTCPNCGQGRLFVFKNLNQNKLYLHCEECETGYYDPNNLNAENSFLTILENFDAKEATSEEILSSSWRSLEFKKVME